jgi:hypothetical protein
VQNDCTTNLLLVPQEALHANRMTGIGSDIISNTIRDLPATDGTETNYKPTNET